MGGYVLLVPPRVHNPKSVQLCTWGSAAEFQHYVKNDVHVRCTCTTPWFQAPRNVEFCAAVPQRHDVMEFHRAVGLQQPDPSCTLLGLWTLGTTIEQGRFFCSLSRTPGGMKLKKIISLLLKVERKRTYGNELRVTLHHCN